jgi:mycofactocin precursor
MGGHISMSEKEKEIREKELETEEKNAEIPAILEEIVIEELAVDGICGIY